MTLLAVALLTVSALTMLLVLKYESMSVKRLNRTHPSHHAAKQGGARLQETSRSMALASVSTLSSVLIKW